MSKTRAFNSVTVRIYSPVEGRTGNLLVHLGNLVKSNDTALVVINQLQPIYVSFSVPSENLDAIKRYLPSGLNAAATPRGGGREEHGKLTFVDNSVDQATGTIQLKATFPNAQRALWPGEFVDVVLTLTSQPNALLVPSEAVQSGQKGPYVFVVKSDGTAESRQVTLGRLAGPRTVIAGGLAAGETVITDGQLRIAPGSRVSVAGKPKL